MIDTRCSVACMWAGPSLCLLPVGCACGRGPPKKIKNKKRMALLRGPLVVYFEANWSKLLGMASRISAVAISFWSVLTVLLMSLPVWMITLQLSRFSWRALYILWPFLICASASWKQISSSLLVKYSIPSSLGSKLPNVSCHCLVLPSLFNLLLIPSAISLHFCNSFNSTVALDLEV